MERYNPFAGSSPSSIQDPAPFSTNFTSDNNDKQPSTPTTPFKSKENATSLRGQSKGRQASVESKPESNGELRKKLVDYSTSFPDPLGDVLLASEAAEATKLATAAVEQQQKDLRASVGKNSQSIDDPVQLTRKDSSKRRVDSPGGLANARNATTKASGAGTSAAAGGFSSFLSRATSVTSSSNISDRVSGAMGGMLNAVDSLSSQIQQVVPSNLNLNERLSSTATNLMGSSSGASCSQPAAMISRQRVVLVIDDPSSTDWISKFSQFGKILISQQQQQQQQHQQHQQQNQQQQASSGTTSNLQQQGQSMLTSILNTSSSILSAPFSSSISSALNNSNNQQQESNQISSIDFNGDLIVQADYRDISVLANQSTGLATVCILPNRQNNDNFNELLLDGNNVYRRQQAANGSRTGASSLVSPNCSVAASGQSSSMTQLNSVGLASNTSYTHPLINYKTIRPEYVVVRQRARKLIGTGLDKDLAAGLLGQIVKAFEYSAIPMFEQHDLWHIFQDRQLIFTRLLRIQRQLGREQFPLIPQVLCQTHHDLINYIQQSAANIPFPVNVILGNSIITTTSTLPSMAPANNSNQNYYFPSEGKIRVDSLVMLRQFASIMVSSGLSCTIEPFLDIKCDLVIQKLGPNLRLYKRNLQQSNLSAAQSTSNSQAPGSPLRSPLHSATSNTSNLRSIFTSGTGLGSSGDTSPGFASNGINATNGASTDTIGQMPQRQHSTPPKLGLGGRQSSLVGSGTKVLSNLINSSAEKFSLDSQRRDSNANNPWSCYERVNTDVSSRHRIWLDAISHEFNGRLQAFSVNIVITNDDREYVVGLNDSSMDFVGSTTSQDEDKRAFVELIINHMNNILPKQGQFPSSPMPFSSQRDSIFSSSPTSTGEQTTHHDKKSDITMKAQKQTNNGFRSSGGSSFRQQHSSRNSNAAAQRSYGQLSNRSQSVTINERENNTNNLNNRLFRDNLITNSNEDARKQGSLGGFFDRRSSEKFNVRDDAMNLHGLDDSTVSIEPHDTTSYTMGCASTMSVSSSQMIDITRSQGPQSATEPTASANAQSNSTLFGQSIFDSTSTAFNSLQRQSLSFFRRLDSRTGQDLIISSTNTPPQSAKSDRAFQHGEQPFMGIQNNATSLSSPVSRTGGFKSQSVDSPEPPYLRSRPPKPPPPSGGSLRKTRQRSLASQQQHQNSSFAAQTSTTPNSTRQNSLAGNSEQDDIRISQEQVNSNQRVTRQNSALSAFEPFDTELRNRQQQPQSVNGGTSTINNGNNNRHIAPSASNTEEMLHTEIRKPLSYDSGSITSGDSSSNGETSGAAAAEDTMKNLKKTFASIFGDKQVE